MTVAIRYYSKTGNTKKLADAIGEVVGVQASDVFTPLEEKVDVLFLGSSIYAISVSPEVKTFISSLHKENVGCVVNFSTAALLKSTYKQVKKLVEAQGIPMVEEEFHCRGSFKNMHQGKPDASDLMNVKTFAKKMQEKYNK